MVLDKYDDSSDYTVILDEFKKELELDLNDKELKKHLERIYNLSLNVFRTRDEVIGKLSNEIAHLKTHAYDMKRRFEKIVESDHLKVKSKIQFLLAVNEHVSYQEIRDAVDTSKRWLDNVIETLIKTKVIGYHSEKDAYYLVF